MRDFNGDFSPGELAGAADGSFEGYYQQFVIANLYFYCAVLCCTVLLYTVLSYNVVTMLYHTVVRLQGVWLTKRPSNIRTDCHYLPSSSDTNVFYRLAHNGFRYLLHVTCLRPVEQY